MKVHDRLRPRFDRQELLFLTISIDPEADDPEALREYREEYEHDWDGWLHLTGRYGDIEGLRWRLGVYDIDPVIDADLTEHSGVITYGNDRTDWWSAMPAEAEVGDIVETICRFTDARKQYPMTPTSSGR